MNNKYGRKYREEIDRLEKENKALREAIEDAIDFFGADYFDEGSETGKLYARLKSAPKGD